MKIIFLTLILAATVLVDVLWKESQKEQQANICKNYSDEN